jgi:hypothetical protein
VITAANLTGFDLQQNFFFVFSEQIKSRGNRMGKGFPGLVFYGCF